jgi:hypothetical protein
MESNVERALAAKMLKLFPPTSDTFLAFPMAGAAFTAADLAIFERPGEAAADVRLRFHRKAQFSRLMNQVPADALSWSTDGELLWTQYKRVLDDAEMATSALTAAEQTRLRAARDYLTDTVTTEQGTTTVYSPEVTAYYRYKEAAEELERTYLDEKLTAEHSLDGAVRAAWDGGRRQLLEAARAKAAQDWAVLGHKAEVETAQATVTALGAKDPQVRRLALLADYDLCAEPDLNANDPVGVRSTFYSPSDIFSPGATWNTLHLTGSEVQQLLAEAPPELAALNTSAGGDIVSMTVEYTSVTVMRPWFEPSFLAMRSWRLPEGVVVSDGGNPRRGRIPGYITSLVVARKVTIERSAPAGQGPTSTGATTALASLGFLRKGLQGLDQQWRVQPLDGPARQLAVQAAAVTPPPSSDHLEVSAPDVSALQNAHVSALIARTTVTQLPVQLAPMRLAASAAAQHVARPLEPVTVPERRLPARPAPPRGAVAGRRRTRSADRTPSSPTRHHDAGGRGGHPRRRRGPGLPDPPGAPLPGPGPGPRLGRPSDRRHATRQPGRATVPAPARAQLRRQGQRQGPRRSGQRGGPRQRAGPAGAPAGRRSCPHRGRRRRCGDRWRDPRAAAGPAAHGRRPGRPEDLGGAVGVSHQADAAPGPHPQDPVPAGR